MLAPHDPGPVRARHHAIPYQTSGSALPQRTSLSLSVAGGSLNPLALNPLAYTDARTIRLTPAYRYSRQIRTEYNATHDSADRVHTTKTIERD